MTWGEIAGLIAALAFAVLVVFLAINLKKTAELIKRLQGTVEAVNHTLSVVTKDVDNLSIEVEALLNKTTYLVDDLNGKLAKTDPLFTAIGDVGESVSNVNQSSRNLAASLTKPKAKKDDKASKLAKISKAAAAFKKIREQRKVRPTMNAEEVKAKKPVSGDATVENDH